MQVTDDMIKTIITEEESPEQIHDRIAEEMFPNIKFTNQKTQIQDKNSIKRQGIKKPKIFSSASMPSLRVAEVLYNRYIEKQFQDDTDEQAELAGNQDLSDSNFKLRKSSQDQIQKRKKTIQRLEKKYNYESNSKFADSQNSSLKINNEYLLKIQNIKDDLEKRGFKFDKAKYNPYSARCTVEYFNNRGGYYLNNLHPINYDDLNVNLEFTFNIWLKPNKFITSDYIVNFDQIIKLFVIGTTGQLQFQNIGGRSWAATDGNQYLNMNAWQRIGVVNSATTLKIFKNSEAIFNIPITWTVTMAKSAMPIYHLGTTSGNNDLYLRDFILWKIALTDIEMAAVLLQQFLFVLQFLIRVGDVQEQKQNMLRYFKLHDYGTGRIQQDYSPEQRHFYFVSWGTLPYISDPDMEIEIATAQNTAIEDPELANLFIDNPVTYPVRVLEPFYPKQFTSITVEFWFKFINFDPTSYEIALVADSTTPTYFSVRTVPGSPKKMCIYLNSENWCSTDFTNGIYDGAWRHYSFQYLQKVPIMYQTLQFVWQSQTPASSPTFQFQGTELKLGTSYANTPASGAVNILMKELRIWSTLRFQTELQFYAYIKLADYHHGALVGYWRLKIDYFNPKRVYDESINPQYSNQMTINNVYLKDSSHLLKMCERGQYWSSTSGVCTKEVNRVETMAYWNYNAADNVWIENTPTSMHIIEFWFTTSIADQTVVKHPKFEIKIVTGTVFGLYHSDYTYQSSTQVFSPDNTYTTNTWSHMYIKFYGVSGGQSRVKVCLNLVCINPDYIYSYTVGTDTNKVFLGSLYHGYFKEIRVWDANSGDDYLHFYKRQIITPYAINTLLDYVRMSGSTPSEIFFHYNYPTTQYIQTSITTWSTTTNPYRLDECLHGYYYTGVTCKEDDKVLRTANVRSDITIFKVNKTEPTSYTFGLWFTFNQNSDGLNLACTENFQWQGFLHLFFSSSTLYMQHNGCIFTLGSVSNYKVGRWYQVVTTKEIYGGIRYNKAYTTDSFAKTVIASQTQDQSVCTSYLFQTNNVYSTIKYGCTERDHLQGIGIKQVFYIENVVWKENDLFMTSRVTWKLKELGAVQIMPLNETNGIWLYDVVNYNYVSRTRSSTNDNWSVFWHHDPFTPKFCSDFYETLDPEKLICGIRKYLFLNADTDQVILDNLPYPNPLPWNQQLSFSMYLRIYPLAYGLYSNVFRMNPTQATAYQLNTKYFQTSYVCGSNTCRNGYMMHDYQNTPTVSYSRYEYINSWAQLTVTRQNGYYYFYDSGILTTTTSSQIVTTVPFDNKIWLGFQVSTTQQYMQGFIRDVKFFTGYLSSAEVLNNFYYRYISQANLMRYYTLEDPTDTRSIYDHAPVTSFIGRTQQNSVNWPTVNNFVDADYFQWSYWRYSYVYAGQNLFSSLTMPYTASWSFQFMFRLYNGMDRLLFNHPNWLQVRTYSDTRMSFYFIQTGQTFYTKGVIESDQFQTITLTYPSSTGGTRIWINDKEYPQFAGGSYIPASTNSLTIDTNYYLQVREIKIWNQIMPYQTMTQLHKKQMDGYYYTNLLFYYNNEFNYVYRFDQRVWIQGQQTINRYTIHGANGYIPTYFCEEDQYWDGNTCAYYYFLFLSTSTLRDLGLPIAPVTVADFTVEFWVLFHETQPLGNFFYLPMGTANFLLAEASTASALTVKICIPACTTISTGKTRSIILADGDRRWRKMMLHFYTSTQQLIWQFDLTTSYTISLTPYIAAMDPTQMNYVTLCQTSCYTAIAHFIIWKSIKTYTDVMYLTTLPSQMSYVSTYYPLTEGGESTELFDLSLNYYKVYIYRFRYTMPFQWLHIKQISNIAEVLLLCAAGTNFKQESGTCEPYLSSMTSLFQTNTNPVRLTNPSTEYTADWTIEFWLNHALYTSSTTFVLPIFVQDPGCTTDYNMAKVAYYIYEDASQYRRPRVTTLKNGVTSTLNNLAWLVRENVWTHISIVNEVKTNLLTNYIDVGSAATMTATSRLSTCDFLLGFAAGGSRDKTLTFQLKELRIWNQAMTLDKLRWQSLQNLQSKGEPNLVKYYRFNEDTLKDFIDDRPNAAVYDNLETLPSFDNTFNFDCPYKLTFRKNARYCQPHHWMIGMNELDALTWNFQNQLKPIIDDGEYSFTIYFQLYTYIAVVSDLLAVQDIIHIYNLYPNFNFMPKFSSGNGTNTTYVPPAGSYILFLNYDLEKGLLNFYMNLNKIFETSIVLSDLPPMTTYEAKIGDVYSGTDVHQFLQNYGLTYPQMTIQEMTKMVSDSMRSIVRHKSGMLQNLRAEYSEYSDPYYAQRPVDMIEESSTTTTQTGSPWWNGAWFPCYPGSRLINGLCLEAMALTIHQQTLALDISNMKVGHSCTLSGFFNIVQIGTSTNEIVFFEVINMIRLIYIDGSIKIVTYDNSNANAQVTTSLGYGLSVNSWYFLAAVHFKTQWKISVDATLIGTITDPNASFEDQTYSSLSLSTASNSLHKLKFYEIAIFGYPKCIGELKLDKDQEIDKQKYHNSLLAYYRIDESGSNNLYDISRYERKTTFSASQSNIYWDFKIRAIQGSNLNLVNSATIVKEKAMLFKYGTTSNINLQFMTRALGTPYTVSFCYYIQNSLYPGYGSTVDMFTISGVMKFQITTTSVLYYYPVVATASYLQMGTGTHNNWYCVVAAYSATEPLAYLLSPDISTSPSYLQSQTNYGTVAASTGRAITVSPFNGYMREIKVFSYAINAGNAFRIYRKQINPDLYWNSYLVSYLKLDESVGKSFMEFTDGTTVTFNDYSGTIVLPEWSEPQRSEKLVICEGDSFYSPSAGAGGYCQSRERFTKLQPSLITSTVNVAMQDFAVSLWILPIAIDSISGFQVQLSSVFKILIDGAGWMSFTIANVLQQGIDVSTVVNLNKWIHLHAMGQNAETYSSNILSYYDASGTLQGIGGQSTKFPWVYSGVLPFTFTVEPYSGNIYARDIQLWNSPLPNNLFKDIRAFDSIDPMRFIQSRLILYFRLDDSGGKFLTNSAMTYLSTTYVAQYIYHATNVHWQFYNEIGADSTTDSATMKAHLFCKDPHHQKINMHCDAFGGCDSACTFNDCKGYDIDSCFTCPSLNSYVYDATLNDCLGCHYRCEDCTLSYQNQFCTACYDPFSLGPDFQDCGYYCTEYQHFIDNQCKDCDDLLCICSELDLTGCLACRDSSNYYLRGSQKCVTDCPDGTFYDRELEECSKCHPYCETCTSASKYDCPLLCNNSLEAYSSVSTYCNRFICTSNEYFDDVSLVCVKCEYPCSECAGSSTACTKCSDQTVFDENGNCVSCKNLNGFDDPWYLDSTGKGVCTEICGDGFNYGQYECDDGNSKNKDGCSSECKLESGFKCTGGSSDSKDNCTDSIGPTVTLEEITQESKQLKIKFYDNNGKVLSDMEYLQSNDLTIVVVGVKGDTQYSFSAELNSKFQSDGSVNIYFNPSFSIPEGGSYVYVLFNNQSQFFDKAGNTLQNKRTNQLQLLKYNYIDADLKAQIERAGNSVSQGTQILLIVNLFLGPFLDVALDSLFVALNSVQLLYYLPLINLPLDPVIYAVFKYLAYANFDNAILQDPLSANINWDNVNDQPLNKAFENYGYTSQVFLWTYRYKLGMWMLIFGIMIFFMLLSLIPLKFLQIFKKLDNFFRYNILIRFQHQMYLEMAILAFSNIYNLQWETTEGIIVTCVALTFMGWITLFPMISFGIISGYANNFNNPFFQQKLSTVIEGTRVIENSVVCQLEFPIFLFRRFVYVLILILGKDYPLIQITLCVLKTFLMVAFYIKVQPFKSNRSNIMSILNETMTGIAFSMVFNFNRSMSQEESTQQGWLIIGIAGFVLFSNVALTLVDLGKALVQLVKNLRQKILNRKNPQNKNQDKDLDQTAKEPLNLQSLNEAPIKLVQYDLPKTIEGPINQIRVFEKRDTPQIANNVNQPQIQKKKSILKQIKDSLGQGKNDKKMNVTFNDNDTLKKASNRKDKKKGGSTNKQSAYRHLRKDSGITQQSIVTNNQVEEQTVDSPRKQQVNNQEQQDFNNLFNEQVNYQPIKSPKKGKKKRN